jgi:hypothetical protein
LAGSRSERSAGILRTFSESMTGASHRGRLLIVESDLRRICRRFRWLRFVQAFFPKFVSTIPPAGT